VEAVSDLQRLGEVRSTHCLVAGGIVGDGRLDCAASAVGSPAPKTTSNTNGTMCLNIRNGFVSI
jgi:hypothetical protein